MNLASTFLENHRETQPLQSYRRLFWGWPKPSQGVPLKDGELIETNNRPSHNTINKF